MVQKLLLVLEEIVDRGHVRVYDYSNGSWTQVSDIDGEAQGDNSGWSVAMSSDGSKIMV